MITVTKPFLPPIEEYKAMIDGIWQRAWLTNDGPLVRSLEQQLSERFNIPHTNFVSNGTIAIQIAIKALELNGEIITTPFSYVATTSSILWESCTPVFADIDPETLNIDPKSIIAAITPETKAILATHVFGNPCDVEAIEQIAKQYHLKVIYDAAHCFGTTYKGKSIFSYGDISTTSFHATKIFHTIEGGAIFTSNVEVHEKIGFLRNFGHNGPGVFAMNGINGKNSEFHAAMGLVNLKYIDGIISRRREQYLFYHEMLRDSNLNLLKLTDAEGFNHSYFPILLKDEQTNLKLIETLEGNQISPRRYFHPSLNTIPLYHGTPCPISESVAARVLCLPLYHALAQSEQELICQVIKQTLQ